MSIKGLGWAGWRRWRGGKAPLALSYKNKNQTTKSHRYTSQWYNWFLRFANMAHFGVKGAAFKAFSI